MIRRIIKLLKSVFYKEKHQNILSNIFLLDCTIHGSHYYDCFSLIESRKLFIGDNLILKRESKNKYDYYAIEVFTENNKKLGYVPKKYNLVIANLIDQGIVVNAYVDNITVNAWDPVTIKIIVK